MEDKGSLLIQVELQSAHQKLRAEIDTHTIWDIMHGQLSDVRSVRELGECTCMYDRTIIIAFIEALKMLPTHYLICKHTCES